MSEAAGMVSADELEAYMNRVEERFMSIHAANADIMRCWQDYRKSITQVQEGSISGVAMDTPTPKATEYLRGIRRLLGEELHPRSKIRNRQLRWLAAAGQPMPPPEEVAAFVQNLRQLQKLRQAHLAIKQQDGGS
jgi:hypothetical protein